MVVVGSSRKMFLFVCLSDCFFAVCVCSYRHIDLSLDFLNLTVNDVFVRGRHCVCFLLLAVVARDAPKCKKEKDTILLVFFRKEEAEEENKQKKTNFQK